MAEKNKERLKEITDSIRAKAAEICPPDRSIRSENE